MAATILYKVEGNPYESDGQVVVRYQVTDQILQNALGDPQLPAIGATLGFLFPGSPLVVVSRRVVDRGPGVVFVDIIFGSRATGYSGGDPNDPTSNIVEFGEDFSYEVVDVPLVRRIVYAAFEIGGLTIPTGIEFAEQFRVVTVVESRLVLSVAVSSWGFAQRQQVVSRIGKLWTIGADKYRLDNPNVVQNGTNAWKVTYTLATQPPLFTSNAWFVELAGGGATPAYVIPDSSLFPMEPFERLHVRMPQTAQGVPPDPTYTVANSYENGVGGLSLPGIPSGFFP